MRTGTSEFTPLHVTKNVTEQAPIHVHVQSSQPTRNARTIDCTLHSSNSNPLWSFTASRTAFSPAAPIMLSNRRRYQIGPACDGHHGRHSGLCSHWPDAVVAHVKRRELGLLAALDGLAGKSGSAQFGLRAYHRSELQVGGGTPPCLSEGSLGLLIEAVALKAAHTQRVRHQSGCNEQEGASDCRI